MTTLKEKQALPDLPYDFNALEPVIAAKIMELHYSKHHQTYVNNLNASLEKLFDAEARGDLATVIALEPAIRFNGGGHLNHSIFWTNLAPIAEGGGIPPQGALAEAINQTFGSLQAFIDSFSAKTLAIQGSGWGWLVLDKESGKLKIEIRANQDPVTGPLVPLLGIDVWEHAYYLQYENRRVDYLKKIWEVVNWKNVEARFQPS